MNKSLIALLTLLIAAAGMFSSAAEAGLKIRLGFGGPLPGFHAHGNGGGYAHRHYKRKKYLAHRAAKKKQYVAKKSAPAPKVAKVEKKVAKPQVVAAETDAIVENSSITTAAIDPIEETTDETETGASVKAESKPERSASKLDCKKFFPSVGMTLTVPCE
jgi:hypothetical protein